MSDEITLPDNFEQKLIEVVDPNQSLDYFESEHWFPIQVLPISLERKLVLLGKAIDFEIALYRACGELVHFYLPFLPLDWASKTFSPLEAQEFYEKHINKQTYNDDIVKVVRQIIQGIEWYKEEDEPEDDWSKYKSANILGIVYTYTNISSEHFLPVDYHGRLTRGCTELMRLNSMITSDRYRVRLKRPTKEEKDPMKNVTSVEDYMTGLAEQGLNVNDLFGRGKL